MMTTQTTHADSNRTEGKLNVLEDHSLNMTELKNAFGTSRNTFGLFFAFAPFMPQTAKRWKCVCVFFECVLCGDETDTSNFSSTS